jgi:DNA-binding protein HU-beta
MVIFSNEKAAGTTTIAEESMVPAKFKIDPKKLFYHFLPFFLDSGNFFNYTLICFTNLFLFLRRKRMAKKPMTKSQIVSYFAKKFEVSKKVAAAIIEEVSALAISETKKSGAFVIPGIGKSVIVKRKARMGRNPATGQAIKIPAKTVVKVRVAKAFKEAIVGKR